VSVATTVAGTDAHDASRAAASPGTVLEQVAALATRTAAAPMDDVVARAVRRCLVDWLGVALAGAGEPAAATVRRTLAAPGRDPHDGFARLLPAGCAPDHAALMLGTAGHALDYDDTDAVNLIHCSATLWPALLALATVEAVSGARMLAVFNAAFEAEDRIGAELGRKLTARGWHVSGVVGHLGAALASGLVLDLPTHRVAHAMAISATAAAGLIGAFGTMSKPLQLARGAADGLVAARLARDGFTGPLALLESEPGLTVPLLGTAITDWTSIARSWGAPWAVTQNSFKPHASCMITHATIDASVALRGVLGAARIGPDDVDRITCHVNPLAPQVAGHRHPRTGLEGKFSVAYCCALGLLDGRATPDGFDLERLARPDIQRLLGRIDVRPDASVGEQQSRVVARLPDGTVRECATAMARGHPANPLSDAELDDKFLHCASQALGSRAPDALADLHRFAAIDDVGRWLDSLR
jgi:2-methylcitrate dehydratase PrpD